MRIKRQRRKLRGKYSGNCLSCNAKWSKCWYIASVENQKDWENRLKVEVNPSVDEVCFQCWDAKIRTSPKRKIHFKTDPIIAENSSNVEQLFGRKEMRNKRRSLNPDFEYIITTKGLQTKKQKTNRMIAKENIENVYDDNEMDRDLDQNLEEISIYEEDVIFDENSAIFLLSTAFGKIPAIHTTTTEISITAISNDNCNINNVNNIKNNGSLSNSSDCAGSPNSSPGSFDEFSKRSDDEFGDAKAKKRGAYYCGKCGKLKKGHVCNVPGADPQDLPVDLQLPSLASLSDLQNLQNLQMQTLPSLASIPGLQVQMQVQLASAVPNMVPTMTQFPTPA